MKIQVFNQEFTVLRAEAMGRIECASLTSATGHTWGRILGYDPRSGVVLHGEHVADFLLDAQKEAQPVTSFLAGAWRLLEKAFSTLSAPSRPGSLSSLDRESTAAMVALALVGYLAFVSIGAAAFGGWLIWFAHRKAEHDVKRARSRLVDEMAGIFPALLARSANPQPWHDSDDADSILGDSILKGNSPHLA